MFLITRLSVMLTFEDTDLIQKVFPKENSFSEFDNLE